MHPTTLYLPFAPVAAELLLFRLNLPVWQYSDLLQFRGRVQAVLLLSMYNIFTQPHWGSTIRSLLFSHQRPFQGPPRKMSRGHFLRLTILPWRMHGQM